MEVDQSDPVEFDSALGGAEVIPPNVAVKEFIDARFQEMEALTSLLEKPSNLFATQKDFPKHMRRRAMSHNVKRIPNRLRSIHQPLREKCNTREGPTKVPRRKHRRRPRNLLEEYNRRQKKHVWLETHIWHAKRFKMVEKWGYKLPLHPNDKSFRACYRASSSHCLVQDLSFWNCLELHGELSCLVEGLKCHIGSDGSDFDSERVINGCTEGHAVFYKNNSYPRGAIGEVNAIWNPSTERHRVVWIWAHPAYSSEVVQELVSTFGLERERLDESNDDSASDKTENHVEMTKLAQRNVPFVRTPKFFNDGVQLILLKDTLNRFRLSGPLAQAVLSKALVPVESCDRRVLTDWTRAYYADAQKLTALEEQRQFWLKVEEFASPAHMPPRCILPLVVYDPRFTLQSNRRCKASNHCEELNLIQTTLPPSLLVGPIWNDSVRDSVVRSKLSTHQINTMRADKIVPGLNFEKFDNDEQKREAMKNTPAIPTMVIQRPGSQKRLGYGSGWDVIVPSGYGMPFWLSFILNGARAGGLREQDNLELEMCKLGPIVPDSKAGVEEDNFLKEQLTDQYFRWPPGKRLNYSKLNFSSPFKCQWEDLVKDWAKTEDFYVLRDRTVLRSLQKSLECREKINLINPPGALVPVQINLTGKGVIAPFAHIYLPRGHQDLESTSTLAEPPHADDNESKRRELSDLHKNLLKRSARKRKKNRQMNTLVGEKRPSDVGITPEMIEEHGKLMRQLWLPVGDSGRFGCSREVMGFMTPRSGFSFVQAASSGLGYVSLEALLAYLTTVEKSSCVFIRSPNTTAYREGHMSIVQ